AEQAADVGEAVERRLPGVRRAIGRAVAPRARHDADDVGLFRREREDPIAAAGDEQRRMRLLHRLRTAVRALVPVVRYGAGDLVLGPQALEERHGLGQAIDADRRRVVRDPEAVVVAVVPAGADAQLAAAARDHVDARGLA